SLGVRWSDLAQPRVGRAEAAGKACARSPEDRGSKIEDRGSADRRSSILDPRSSIFDPQRLLRPQHPALVRGRVGLLRLTGAVGVHQVEVIVAVAVAGE